MGGAEVEITQVRIFPVAEDKLKAFVSIIIDDCFVVSDIKIINGNNGLFISMPSKKRKNGTFRDIAHPLNSETRRMLEEKILAKYNEALAQPDFDQAAREEQPEAPAGKGGAPDAEGGPVPASDHGDEPPELSESTSDIFS